MLTNKDNGYISIVAADCSFFGNFSSNGILRIDGNLEGKVICDWLIIGESAKVKGEFHVRGITVSGILTGNIHASELVEITEFGNISGEIKTKHMSIEDGGTFEGLSIMPDEPMELLESPRPAKKEKAAPLSK
ncbi:MAG: polymer-forming cytoskeletal protein [Nitrospirae bacterium]|nr:polymer-forming cytoskeletal protein [Nitrospirota bacterium]